MADKQPCSVCGVLILPRTAQRTGGLCMPCSTGNRERWKQAERLRDPAERVEFAPNDQVEALRPFVDEFWSRILETSYATSFVSNESTLESWQHYVGGRVELIERVRLAYGVDTASTTTSPYPACCAESWRAPPNTPLHLTAAGLRQIGSLQPSRSVVVCTRGRK
jgi:hypothetical protein